YYFVYLNDTNGCAVTTSSIFKPVGIFDPAADIKQLIIYPNPASEQLIIDNGELIMGNTSVVRIYDVLGKTVLQSEITPAGAGQKSEIDVHGLPGGLYLVRITNGNEMGEGQFVVEK